MIPRRPLIGALDRFSSTASMRSTEPRKAHTFSLRKNKKDTQRGPREIDARSWTGTLRRIFATLFESVRFKKSILKIIFQICYSIYMCIEYYYYCYIKYYYYITILYYYYIIKILLLFILLLLYKVLCFK